MVQVGDFFMVQFANIWYAKSRLIGTYREIPLEETENEASDYGYPLHKFSFDNE